VGIDDPYDEKKRRKTAHFICCAEKTPGKFVVKTHKSGVALMNYRIDAMHQLILARLQSCYHNSLVNVHDDRSKAKN